MREDEHTKKIKQSNEQSDATNQRQTNNIMARRKRTYKDLQNTTQKIKD